MRVSLKIFVGVLASVPAFASSAYQALAPSHSIASDFPKFFDQTTAMSKKERVSAFKEHFKGLYPGFYEPMLGETQARYDERVSTALDEFPVLRSRYEQVEQTFPQIFTTAMISFHKRFEGFPPSMPIWFVHSLGRMDGGTRVIDGKINMIFGADVIARIHDDAAIGPFLDHELFHVENSRWFKDCNPDTTIWCSLWQEGTAVYNASMMNLNATDHMLMLDTPTPIRASVDANWQDAICRTLRDLDRTDEKTYADYFLNGGKPQGLPRRWGYYVAYRMVKNIGYQYSIQQIDHFDHVTARRVMTTELESMSKDAGGCN